MQPTFKFNTTQFNSTLARAAAGSRRAAKDVVNGHMMAVALGAVKLTEKADKAKIAYVLGQVGTQLNYTKRGDRLRKGMGANGRAIIREDSFAARIVNARRREYAGADYMLWGTALEDAARKLILARQSSSAFIKSGWLWAIRDLAKYVRGGRGNPDRQARASGQRKGKATAAVDAGTGIFKAVIENTALIASGGKHQSKGASNPLPIAERGLSLAIDAEHRNMENHLRKKMVEEMKKAGAL